jgi:hypothetical protein
LEGTDVLTLMRLKKGATNFHNAPLIDHLYFHKMGDADRDINKSFYINFLSNERSILTEVDLANGDTTSNTFSYSFYRIDSLSIVSFSNTSCRSYLLTSNSNDTINLLSVRNGKYSKSQLIPEGIPPKFQTTKEKLLGIWTVQRCSRPDIQKIKTLRITEKYIDINEQLLQRESGLWRLDAFGKVILADVESEFHFIKIRSVSDEQLTVENNGIIYVLKKSSKN